MVSRSPELGCSALLVQGFSVLEVRPVDITQANPDRYPRCNGCKFVPNFSDWVDVRPVESPGHENIIASCVPWPYTKKLSRHVF